MMVALIPMWATRAIGAEDYSLGQRPRYTITKLFTRYRRSSSRRRYRNGCGYGIGDEYLGSGNGRRYLHELGHGREKGNLGNGENRHHPRDVTPTATAAPVARIDCGRELPGALPQAVNFCAYGARCLRSQPQPHAVALSANFSGRGLTSSRTPPFGGT